MSYFTVRLEKKKAFFSSTQPPPTESIKCACLKTYLIKTIPKNRVDIPCYENIETSLG